MAHAPWDVIIVGQGLAGTTLAWHLQNATQRVLLIDAHEAVTSSKIAAGLITPITGQRMSLSWRCDEFLPVAQNFYKTIEQRTGRKFFHDRTAVRLFKSDKEQTSWRERKNWPEFQTHLHNPAPEPLLNPTLADTTHGGFAMHAAQLDVAAYLEASRDILATQEMTIDWQRDVTLTPDAITVQGHTTRHLISCEGFAASRNPYFACVPFNAAKGDILTVRFHNPVPPKCLHRGTWIAPTADPQVFRVGATYDRQTLDQIPSPTAREQIEAKLKEFFHVPYTVLEHHAAVRPIIHESKPVIGFHPTHQRLGYFNGLGSKGSMLAPWFAHAFTEHLLNQTPIPTAFDLRKFF